MKKFFLFFFSRVKFCQKICFSRQPVCSEAATQRCNVKKLFSLFFKILQKITSAGKLVLDFQLSELKIFQFLFSQDRALDRVLNERVNH